MESYTVSEISKKYGISTRMLRYYEQCGLIASQKRDGASVSVGLGSADAVRAAFDVLKEGGGIGAAPESNFFCECYCEVRDKFGVNWIMMYH